MLIIKSKGLIFSRSVVMDKKSELEQEIIKLKLEKRELVLSGKNTERVDKLIKEIEDDLNELVKNI